MSNNEHVDIREMSALNLAFVGDAVYSLAIRKYFVSTSRHSVNSMNSLVTRYVSAHGQFMAVKLIENKLTEEELAVLKRGKNSSKATVAKHASSEEYRASTGFECLLGFLELSGRKDRIDELVSCILAELEFDE